MRQPLYAAAALLGCVAAAPAIRPTVSIASGAVVGTATMVSTASAVPVNRYLGIPFAQSPPERFSPPINPADWTEPLDASKFKDACVQQFNCQFTACLKNRLLTLCVDPEASRNFSMTIFNNPGGAPPVESEDCLYLNVFTPATKAPAGGRTVMFWIYGGDLQFGTASLSRYDGSSFAANQDVVVVTTNYRTNGKKRVTPLPTKLILCSLRVFKFSRDCNWQAECWLLRPTQGTGLGSAEHRAVRRGPNQGDHIWRVRWWLFRQAAAGRPSIS
jgi:hypothetical protein